LEPVVYGERGSAYLLWGSGGGVRGPEANEITDTHFVLKLVTNLV